MRVPLVGRLIVLVALLVPAVVRAQELTLERIMGHPDWISRQPENPYWSDDGRFVYYVRKRAGSELRDLFRVDVQSGATSPVADSERAAAGAPGGDWNSTWTERVFSRGGDVYLSALARGGTMRQLTRSAVAEEDPIFLVGDEEVAYRRGGDWFARHLESGLERQLAEVRFEKDPEAEEPADEYLSRQQERLLDIVAQRKARKKEADERARAERRGDPSRVPPAFYLGEKAKIDSSYLAPSGRAILLLVVKSDAAAHKQDKMPDFITESGYVEVRDLRPKVGAPQPETPRVVLLDLVAGKHHDLALDVLPGIKDDPLKELRAKAEAAKKARTAKEPAKDAKAEEKAEEKAAETAEKEKKPEEPKARVVSIDDVRWNDEGTRVLVQAFSFDNKDRWIAVADLGGAAKPALLPVVRTTDPAWINWDFRELGWMRDGRTVWYLSEETGYSQLWLRDAADEKSKARQLTKGSFVVSDPVLARDGKSLLVTANREHPGIFEVYRVDATSGGLERLTEFGGLASFTASADSTQLAVLPSTVTRPPELYVQAAAAGAQGRKMSDTITPEFAAVDWAQPEVVAVPSSHQKAPIYSRVYTPPAPWAGKPPAVVFVHGAGYLQNAHHGWSSYFREFMFHTLLVRAGYVVLDMDYRASAGYGRDWRTAIYRQMGTPELEDLQDGVRWLVTNRNVDPRRVGVYGGSYGGFMTFMALFKDPDLFACGAALRPVADWAHYNHPYTANILNTPEVDPEAYERSSPIEFAAGLRKPLLILHGMVDDNVVFQDSVRLVQRLIELKKTEYFETAIYPIEPHAFREPSSWLDEYTRIWLLMERNLK